MQAVTNNVRLFPVRRNSEIDGKVGNPVLYSKIDSLVLQFRREFRDGVAKAFHLLHQRAAEGKQIEKVHNTTADVLSAAHKEVRDALTAMQGLPYAFIPVVSSPCTNKADCLAAMLDLEMVSSMLLKESEELQVFLRSKNHQQALQYFKEVVEQLDALSDWGNALDWMPGRPSKEEKGRKLHHIYTEVTENIAKAGYLYTPLLRYMLYVALSLDVQNVVEGLKDILGSKGLDYQPSPKDLRDLQQVLVEARVDGVELLPEEQFRAGRYISNIVTNIPGMYHDIRPIMDEMERIKRSIKQTELCLYQQIRNVANGAEVDLQPLGKRLEDDKILLNHLFNELLKKTFSTQVHAGWYYEDAVRHDLDRVTRCFTEVQAKLAGNFGLQCKAVKALHTYAQEEKSATDIRVAKLYDALLAASAIQITDEDGRIYRVIEQTVAKEGETLLAFTSEEKKVPTYVFQRNYNWNEHKALFISYLMKGFLWNMHFKDIFGQDYEFEAVFYMLKYDPVYKAGFEASLAESQLLRTLHDGYVAQHNRCDSLEIMKALNRLLIAMYEQDPPHADGEDLRLILFTRIFSLEKEVGALQFRTKSDECRISWLSRKVTQFKEHHKTTLALEKDVAGEFPTALYNALHRSYFSTGITKKVTEAELSGLISNPGFAPNSLTGILKVLLYRWRLENFMQTLDVDETDMSLSAAKREITNFFKKEKELSVSGQILETFFGDYTHNPDAARLWRFLYDFGYMELALREYGRHCHDKKFIKGVRQEEGSLWDTILDYYTDFRTIVDHYSGHIRGSKGYKRAEGLYTQAQTLFNNTVKAAIPPGENPISIAKALLLEMKQFLDGSRFSYSKEFLA